MSGPFKSERRAACSRGAACGSLLKAAAATSWSALKAPDMYRTTLPFLLAAATANSLLPRSASGAYLYAAASRVTTSNTKLSLDSSDSLAPFSTPPLPLLAAVRIRLRSPRSGSDAPFSAVPSPARMASSTNLRSLLRESEAASKASPVCCTALRTSDLSPLSLSEARCRATPLLCSTAVNMSSRSSLTSSGTLKSCCQSSMTIARQEFDRQLFRLMEDACGSSVAPCTRPPFFSAAAWTPCSTAAKASRVPSSGGNRFLEAMSPYVLASLSSSSPGRSFVRPKSFRILSADLPFIIRAAWTQQRKVRD
mmetsp:Transcript_15797/g.47444  ORF Transcript_15797/g.47444 Transcript_15797/m.47444 type:complete len:309 (-) Transcript_15797:452-1378(-)